ncbi:hypothetical protein ACIG0D_20460 [Streptomyces sp. NPDC052773]
MTLPSRVAALAKEAGWLLAQCGEARRLPGRGGQEQTLAWAR